MDDETEYEEIEYEKLIAGMLLKFDEIDNVDFSLIIDDFKSKTNYDDRIYWLWYDLENIGEYVTWRKNGIVSLRNDITFDYFIEKENKTLREKLVEVAGDVVNDYINNLDIEKYKEEKEKVLTSYKERTLNEANVLLISEVQDDYDEIIKYGFKNVDCFKSIIRADNYFAKHPEELEKYHLVLIGNQSTEYAQSNAGFDLAKKICEMRFKRQIVDLSLNRYDYLDQMELTIYLRDENHDRSWHIETSNYHDIFDGIVDNMLINHALENKHLKDKNFVPIEDKINPNRLPLPEKKSDLKILYLGTERASEHFERVANELGLNINFKEDSNPSLGRYVIKNLGEYDIIITSGLYSSSILRMNQESTEQCKDTGRELTMLACYDDSYSSVDRDLGDSMEIRYVFGGNFAPDSDCYEKEFRVLREPIVVEDIDEYFQKISRSSYSQMKSVISSSVNFYNGALVQMNKSPISDLNLKSADEINRDYVLALEEKERKEKEELAPVISFDNIRYSAETYLCYQKEGLIDQIPGLKITEGEDGIRVENIYQGRTICAIVFPKKYKYDNLRIFEIQTLSKKGVLSEPQTVGVYTSKYENLESIPNRPDEKQEKALNSIEKKIKNALTPLNEKAFETKLNQRGQRKLKSKRR